MAVYLMRGLVPDTKEVVPRFVTNKNYEIIHV